MRCLWQIDLLIQRSIIMRYIQLGKTALQVSRICYGTWQFGGDWGTIERDEAQSTIRNALDLGINLFDTAHRYGFGMAERVLGEALRAELKNKRDSIVIATKGGLRMEDGTLRRDSSSRWLFKEVDQSLKNLGVD